MNHKYVIVLNAMLALFAPVAFAAGGSDAGNGGGGIELPDGRIVLADPYFNRSGGCDTCGELAPELKKSIEGTAKLLAVHNGNEWTIKDMVLNRLVEYRFVEQLPRICAENEHREDYQIPAGDQFVALGCTQGKITYLVAERFKKLSLRDQTKLILHERLHDHVAQAPHEHINDLTDIINVLLDLFQREQDGEKLVLSAAEHSLLSRLSLRLGQLKLNHHDSSWFLDNFAVAPQGGGVVSKQLQLASTAYIDISSIVGGKGTVSDGVSIIGSNIGDHRIDFTIQISNETVIKNTVTKNDFFGTLQIGANVTLRDTELSTTHPHNQIIFENAVSVNKSTLRGDSYGSLIRVRQSTSVENSVITGLAEIGPQAVMSNSTFSGRLQGAKALSVINSKITGDFAFEENVFIKDSEIKLTNAKGLFKARSKIKSSFIEGRNASEDSSFPVSLLILGKNSEVLNSELNLDLSSNFENYGRIVKSIIELWPTHNDQYGRFEMIRFPDCDSYNHPLGCELLGAKPGYPRSLTRRSYVGHRTLIQESELKGLVGLIISDGAQVNETKIEGKASFDSNPRGWSASDSMNPSLFLEKNAGLNGVHFTAIGREKLGKWHYFSSDEPAELAMIKVPSGVVLDAQNENTCPDWSPFVTVKGVVTFRNVKDIKKRCQSK